MRLFEKRWRDIHSTVLEHTRLTMPGKILFRLSVQLYPKRVKMENPIDKCSLCREEWCNIDGGMNHAHGLPHFRQWCLEHPLMATARWGDQIRQLVAEETLAGLELERSA
jgi:hypothetical protein